MTARQMIQFFYLLFELYSLEYLISAFQIQFHGVRPPFALCFDLENAHLNAKGHTFKPVKKHIFFLQKIC